jgi:sodium-dependent dicarboxylate transporter 2/3/5
MTVWGIGALCYSDIATVVPVLGVSPHVLILACTLGANSAYMMPVGAPPNAIVFGTGLVRLPQMMPAGFWLNLADILPSTARDKRR